MLATVCGEGGGVGGEWVGMVNVGGPTHLRRVERRDASWGRAPHASARRSGRQHLRRGGRRASVTTGSYAARNARHDVVTREPTDGVERPKYRRDRLRALYMFATLSATRRAAHQTSPLAQSARTPLLLPIYLLLLALQVSAWTGFIHHHGPNQGTRRHVLCRAAMHSVTSRCFA